MYFKNLLTAAAAASLPLAHAIYDPDAEPVDAAGAVAATFALVPEPPADGEGTATAAEGDAAVTTLMATEDVEEAVAAEGDAAVTTLVAPGDANKPPPQDPRLVGPTWSATKYYSAEGGRLVPVAADSVVTLEIEEDGAFDGHAGCNNYFGSFANNFGSFAPVSTAASVTRSAAAISSFLIDGPVGSTRMMCEGLMAQEAAYLANFGGTVNFRVFDDGKEMEMTDETGNVVGAFALFTPPILGQTWTATRYYSLEEEGLVDVLPGSAITLEMEVDEKLGGNAGCNKYVGAYDDLTRDSFKVAAPLTSTEMMCVKPENVMAQESAYLQNFENGRLKWAVLEDGSLELKDADSGATIALYDKAPETRLEAVSDPLATAFDPSSTSGSVVVRTALAAITTAVASAFYF